MEASELLEYFQWRDDNDFWRKYKKDSMFREEIADEIADVLIYTLILSKILSLDPEEIINKKIVKNAKKYPIGKI